MDRKKLNEREAEIWYKKLRFAIKYRHTYPNPFFGLKDYKICLQQACQEIQRQHGANFLLRLQRKYDRML